MTTVKSKRLRTLLLAYGAAALVLFGIWLLLCIYGLKLPCPFKALFRIDCPGCGNTRAVLAYLRLDFAAGFRYNYLFPLEALYILHVVALSSRHYLENGKYHYGNRSLALDVTVLVLLLAWTVVRNILKI